MASRVFNVIGGLFASPRWQLCGAVLTLRIAS
jgi:hypothetical protein